jgi:hypothetical protein
MICVLALWASVEVSVANTAVQTKSVAYSAHLARRILRTLIPSKLKSCHGQPYTEVGVSVEWIPAQVTIQLVPPRSGKASHQTLSTVCGQADEEKVSMRLPVTVRDVYLEGSEFNQNLEGQTRGHQDPLISTKTLRVKVELQYRQ